ncbi:MAG: VOC family protein [Bacteroidia bacterium]
MKWDHVGIVCQKESPLPQLIESILGVKPTHEILSSEAIEASFFDIPGGSVELIFPQGENHSLLKFLGMRQAALHHIAFAVENIESALQKMEEKGFIPIAPAPRPGARGKKVAFLHPKSTGGILIELCQKSQ